MWQSSAGALPVPPPPTIWRSAACGPLSLSGRALAPKLPATTRAASIRWRDTAGRPCCRWRCSPSGCTGSCGTPCPPKRALITTGASAPSSKWLLTKRSCRNCGPRWGLSTAHRNRALPPSGWNGRMPWPWSRACRRTLSPACTPGATGRWTGWNSRGRWPPPPRSGARRSAPPARWACGWGTAGWSRWRCPTAGKFPAARC